jgi:hypothetical protein
MCSFEMMVYFLIWVGNIVKMHPFTSSLHRSAKKHSRLKFKSISNSDLEIMEIGIYLPKFVEKKPPLQQSWEEP